MFQPRFMMNWRAIFDFDLFRPVTAEEIVARHRTLAKQHHPDLGGSVEAMQEINAAKAAALAELTGVSAPSSQWVKAPKRRRRRKQRKHAW